MKDIGTKVRLIFIPYLILYLVTISGYTFLHWLLFIENNVFSVYEDILNFFIPMILPGIPILIWLRPRVKLLDLKKTPAGKDPIVGFIMLAWIGMVVPLVIAQEYLISATGELTRLADISEINNVLPTKYYMVDKYIFMKEQACKMPEYSVSGKRNQYFDMSLLIAVPIFSKKQKKQEFDFIRYDRKTGAYFFNGEEVSIVELGKLNPNAQATLITYKDSITDSRYDKVRNFYFKLHKPEIKNAYGWLTLRYDKTISNRLPKSEKNEQFDEFIDECYRDLDTLQLNEFVYLTRIGKSFKLDKFQEMTRDDIFFNKNNSVNFFERINEPFERRNGHKLLWLLGTILVGSSMFFLLLLSKPLKNNIPRIGYF